MIAECLEALIKEKIPLETANLRTGISAPCPLEEIPPCSMSRQEIDFFYRFARKFGGPILEFGAYAGGSARAFWHGVYDMPSAGVDTGWVYSVDLYHRWEKPSCEFPGLVQITGNSRSYAHEGETPLIGFEDCDHTRLCTRDGLHRLHEAGCEILLVHDICPKKLLDAPMPMEETSRAGALEFFNEHPEYHLIEVQGGQGIFIALKAPHEFA